MADLVITVRDLPRIIEIKISTSKLGLADIQVVAIVNLLLHSNFNTIGFN